jgi:hypothetical protein
MDHSIAISCTTANVKIRFEHRFVTRVVREVDVAGETASCEPAEDMLSSIVITSQRADDVQ